ncbi:hypothetical protein TrST_g12839 [Triparma strigata]|uniref:Uncharacterized protein n=2 Tax=Triparma TaxID=722752 RepID=A0A9W7EP98_9STRA|nr:hypothetical protein TrST_g12839 [Triparma strigata]
MISDRLQPDVDCGLTESTELSIPFGSAFAFSLETATTVGYGLPGSSNAFFEGCPELQICIFFQMLFSLFFNAFLFAFFFARLSRAETRGIQVLFSSKAVVRRRGGKWEVVVRCYDCDCQHPLVESHVRFYAVKRNERGGEGQSFERMRTNRPDDDYGAVLFTSLPSSVSHEIDEFSPILPPTLKKRKGAEFMIAGHGLENREADSRAGNRDGLQCLSCGESYGSWENLVRHIKYSRIVEKADAYPKQQGCCRHLDLDIDTSPPAPALSDRASHEEFDSYFRSEGVEILAVLEAIDPLMSGTFQALQSYTIDDISFGGEFTNCIRKGKKSNAFEVDFTKFHSISHSNEIHDDSTRGVV